MSYEYYLQACEDQGPQQVLTEPILAIFAPFIVKRDATYIDLEFDEMNQCTVYLETDGSTIDGLMISMPCGAEALVRCIYEVMRLGFFVFFEPDGHREHNRD
jgi:hypothetical protein